MKCKIKNIFTILIIMMMFFSIFNVCYAEGDDISSIIDNMSDLATDPGVDSDNKLVKGVNVVYTIIRVAGTGIALLMVIMLGIKYMITSVEEKAEIKKQAVPIVVGSALIFATSNILGIIAKMVEET